MSTRQPYLRVDLVADQDGVRQIAAIGEIDMLTGDQLETTLRAHLHEERVRALSVDLSQLTFIDSSGIRILVIARRIAEERGIRFAVVNVAANIRDALQMVGVYELLTEGA